MAERKIEKRLRVCEPFPLDPLDGGVKSEEQHPQLQADLLAEEKVKHEANRDRTFIKCIVYMWKIGADICFCTLGRKFTTDLVLVNLQKHQTCVLFE